MRNLSLFILASLATVTIPSAFARSMPVPQVAVDDLLADPGLSLRFMDATKIRVSEDSYTKVQVADVRGAGPFVVDIGRLEPTEDSTVFQDGYGGRWKASTYSTVVEEHVDGKVIPHYTVVTKMSPMHRGYILAYDGCGPSVKAVAIVTDPTSEQSAAIDAKLCAEPMPQDRAASHLGHSLVDTVRGLLTSFRAPSN